MRGTGFAAVAVLVCAASAQLSPSVTISEAKIRAILRDESTVIVVPVSSTSDRPAKGELSLAWLDRDEKVSREVHQPVTIQPGESSLEVPLPIANSSIWTRLRYSLTPDRSDPRTFSSRGGIVSISQIASHVFELRASHAGVFHRGSPVTIHAQAVHPVTRMPVPGVKWTGTLSIGDAEIDPVRTSEKDGFVDFTFDLPKADEKDAEKSADVEITGELGDFEAGLTLYLGLNDRPSARLQTDKPIYQPGQTMHLRAVVRDSEGRAAEDAKVTLRIEDGEHERVHTAQLVASKFGIVHDDWQLPASAALGAYEIVLTAEGDDNYQLAQHIVRVNRYELPTFQVTAKTDRTTYLPGETPQVTITGMYLFGKPVPKGRVKIVRGDDGAWEPKSEDDGTAVAEGEAGDDGKWTTTLDISTDQQELVDHERRFQDLRFAAYYKDPSSGRTEQRRFDIRLTRQPIHVYLIHKQDDATVFVSTSYADGRPAAVAVEIRFNDHTVSLQTNRYGVGKTVLPAVPIRGSIVKVHATDGAGLTGDDLEQYWPAAVPGIHLTTAHTIHRAGESVTLQIITDRSMPADQPVLVYAIAGDRRVASRSVRTVSHTATLTFPYQPEFRRTVVFVAWHAAGKSYIMGATDLGSRAVIFPDGSDLNVSALAAKATYKPGENASLRMRFTSADGRPVEAALGLAVVDQAVLERARTDMEFGSRPWFACAYCAGDGDAELGGVSLKDLYTLKPSAAIFPELDLVAEALLAGSSAMILTLDSESASTPPTFAAMTLRMQQLKTILDRQWADTLTFPQAWQDFSGLVRQLGSLDDPWGEPLVPEFSVEGENRVLTLRSPGPDKRIGTADDFVVGTFRRSYFLPVRRWMEDLLRNRENYPASESEFETLLSSDGLLFSSLHDPWGTPYRVAVATFQTMRQITITSAGPDRTFDTGDDFSPAYFSGPYFRHETAEIRKALAGARPQTVEEFRAVLQHAGIDVDRYRDAWNRPYRLEMATSFKYEDRITRSRVSVFGASPVPKTEVVPVTRRYLVFVLRSGGPDGPKDTFDDFEIARFTMLLDEQSAQTQPDPLRAGTAAPAGTGTIVGTIQDPSGAVVPNAKVTLLDPKGQNVEGNSDDVGNFEFTAVPGGMYSIRAVAPGFMSTEVSQVPVTPGKTTVADLVLQVGSTMETVSVEASPALLQTSTSSVALQVAAVQSTALSTPRVREYFPETLLWIPEVVTGADGTAQTQFPLADSVTQWKIAVVASTLDGRMAEAESEFRTFQPFFLDFTPPLVLTEGDRVELPVAVRNYQDRAQDVNVSWQANDWSTVQGPAAKRVNVAANSSVVVPFLVQANKSQDKAPQRVIATAARSRDAIEKSSRVHPDGQEVIRTLGDLMVGKSEMLVSIPQSAIPGATHAELRLYPNLASILWESANGILVQPHGCAEQTISAGYSNLVAWKFAQAAGITDARIEKRALANVRQAVDALSGFRAPNGGVGYWTAGNADIAVTAHALSFLTEAAQLVNVTPESLKSLVSFLEARQASNGTWQPRWSHADQPARDTLLLTGLVTRSLAAAQKSGIAVSDRVLAGAYHHMAEFTDETDEPYLLANFILSTLDAGDEQLLGNAAARLAGLAHEERGGLYWDLQTNSPFYGWGTAGRYETTGLVVSALSAWRTHHKDQVQLDTAIRRGAVFLLRGRDAMGTWYSTQSTLRSMRGLADASLAIGGLGGHGGAVEVRANGRLVKTLAMPDSAQATDPILLDLSSFLPPGENQVTLIATGGSRSALVRLTASHWLPWTATTVRNSPELRLAVEFDHLGTSPGQPVRCSVKAERVGFRGYGMMLAEIGLPPGAEVDRASLQRVIEGPAAVDRYDVLPDRVILYLWPEAGGTAFDFYVSARTPMVAKSAPSVLYDYYNPESRTEVEPSRWVVK